MKGEREREGLEMKSLNIIEGDDILLKMRTREVNVKTRGKNNLSEMVISWSGGGRDRGGGLKSRQ